MRFRCRTVGAGDRQSKERRVRAPSPRLKRPSYFSPDELDTTTSRTERRSPRLNRCPSRLGPEQVSTIGSGDSRLRGCGLARLFPAANGCVIQGKDSSESRYSTDNIRRDPLAAALVRIRASVESWTASLLADDPDLGLFRGRRADLSCRHGDKPEDSAYHQGCHRSLTAGAGCAVRRSFAWPATGLSLGSNEPYCSAAMIYRRRWVMGTLMDGSASG